MITIKSPGLPHLQGSTAANIMKNRYANINACKLPLHHHLHWTCMPFIIDDIIWFRWRYQSTSQPDTRHGRVWLHQCQLHWGRERERFTHRHLTSLPLPLRAIRRRDGTLLLRDHCQVQSMISGGWYGSKTPVVSSCSLTSMRKEG